MVNQRLEPRILAPDMGATWSHRTSHGNAGNVRWATSGVSILGRRPAQSWDLTTGAEIWRRRGHENQ